MSEYSYFYFKVGNFSDIMHSHMRLIYDYDNMVTTCPKCGYMDFNYQEDE